MTTSTEVEATSRLHELAGEIGTEFVSMEERWHDALQHAIAAGEKLVEAKALVKHGEWLPWLESHFPKSQRTASNCMKLARKSAEIADLPTVREALAALAPPKQPEAIPPVIVMLDGFPDGTPLTDELLAEALADLRRAIATGESHPRVSRATAQVALALVEWNLAHHPRFAAKGD